MLDILPQGDFRVVHLTNGEFLGEAVKLIDKGKADGINLNYTRNRRTDLEPLRNSKTIKFLVVNDYPPSVQYDYSAIQTLTNLQHLSIHTKDRKEIDFLAFPFIKSVALTWRPKARSLFSCVQLQRLFLNRYTGQDLTELFDLKNLRFLRVNLGSVKTLRGLKDITELEELMLMQNTKLEDVDELLTFRQLKRLRIDNCKRVKNIGDLKKMNIKELEIVGTTPTS